MALVFKNPISKRQYFSVTLLPMALFASQHLKQEFVSRRIYNRKPRGEVFLMTAPKVQSGYILRECL